MPWLVKYSQLHLELKINFHFVHMMGGSGQVIHCTVPHSMSQNFFVPLSGGTVHGPE